MTPYTVRCLDAKYDESEGMLVMNTVFEHNGDRKIVVFSKQDVSISIFHKNDIGHKNMHLFATAMSKRSGSFKLIIEDDPNRKIMSEEELMKYGATFNKRIADELEKVQEGLSSERGQIQRKLGQLVDEGKLDAASLLKEEQVVRGKLGLNNL